MDLGLKDKVAVVLASSRGMGRASAEALAAEGCRVAICARGRKALQEAAKQVGAAYAQPCDVTRRADMERFLKAVVRKFGAVHILVNNCGGPEPGTFFEVNDERKWQAAFERSLMQVVNWTYAVAPIMIQQRWGRIVNIVSTSVKQPIDGLLLSNSIRPGVIGFSKSVSRELAKYNVLINSVLPGSIRTDRTLELAEAAARREGLTVEKILERKAQEIPMGRLGEPSEVGAVVAFLCSERAGYLTGAAIPVDGGLLRCV